MTSTRPTRFRGRWYPDSTVVLDGLLKPGEASGGKADPRLVGAALPHAGLQYSAAGQRIFYRMLPDSIRDFVLLAPSHYIAIGGSSFIGAEYDGYDAAYRLLPTAIDPGMQSAAGITMNNAALEGEHALELLLPGLARFAPDGARVCALLTPHLESESQMEALAEQLMNLTDRALAGRPWILLVSSDFTHYGPRFSHQPLGNFTDPEVRRKVRHRDLAIAEQLTGGRWRQAYARMTECGAPTICGIAPLVVQSIVASRLGWEGEILSYYHSAELSGTYDGSRDAVAYCTLAYRKKGEE
jgi:AmmeMemoRadiSam system protein B